jgi:hypothetical protein
MVKNPPLSVVANVNDKKYSQTGENIKVSSLLFPTARGVTGASPAVQLDVLDMPSRFLYKKQVALSISKRGR